VAEIQGRIVRLRERGALSKFIRAKSDKDAIAAWKVDLNGILHVFNVRSASPQWHLLKLYVSDGAVIE
jgi:hypothetical protein